MFTSLIGLGYHDTITPPVILRNVLENPAWYTAYTPYQPEISQGRLEALLNFQTMVSDLTGMDLANASLLDEGTAAAEAMAMLHRLNPKAGTVFFVDADAHPQTIDVVRTRAEPLGIEVVVGDPDAADFGRRLLRRARAVSGQQRPAARSRAGRSSARTRRGALVCVAADLLALDARDAARRDGRRRGRRYDAALRRAARLRRSARRRTSRCATSTARTLPGRLVGVSIDAEGRTAFRLALQTREQHIRREKATSNICTAQVLLAVIAGSVRRVPRRRRVCARSRGGCTG